MLGIFEVVNFEFLNIEEITAWLMTFSAVEKSAEFFKQAEIKNSYFIAYVGFDVYLVIMALFALILFKLVMLMYLKL